jgi:hypothetical protein
VTTKVFLGTDGAEWSTDDNWDPAGAPADGDVAIIGGGASDASGFVVLDVAAPDHATIQLGVTGGVIPATLDVTGADLPASLTIDTAGGATDFTAIAPGQTLLVHASTVLNGLLAAEALDETLTVDLDSATGSPADLTVSHTATVLDGPESGIDFTDENTATDGGGTVTVAGQVLVEGGVQIGVGSFVVADGGQVDLQNGGVVTVEAGADVSSAGSGRFVFEDGTGTLRIADLAAFQADIAVTVSGARVLLDGISADHATYAAGQLTLYSGATQVGVLDIDDPDGGGTADFRITAPALPGAPTTVTYAPDAPGTVLPTLPLPVLAAPGQAVNAAAFLQQAFGTLPAQWASYELTFASAADLQKADFAYWDPTDPSISQWSVPDGTTVSAADIGTVSFEAGNEIGPLVDFRVPVAGPADAPTVYASYQIDTVDPAVAGPTIGTGHVTPMDIVDSALRYAAAYGGVPNANDCGFIADAVAAAAGAGFPQNLLFSDEQGGGFWRVVYRGADQTDPVQNWSTLVQPGDIVKMAWEGSGGHHVTTVTGTVTAQGLPVFDNVAPGGTIGLHLANYWNGTDPASIVIFRLDPNQQYLIYGTGQGEFIQGSPYNNLILPGGPAEIAAGLGDNEIQDTVADLDGVQVTDFHTGDWFDATDIGAKDTTPDYDPGTGLLTLTVGGSLAATITLPTGLVDNFAASPDGNNGTFITDVACFAEGTRLMTPDGPVAVERLAVGDHVVTLGGRSRPIVWIGRREVDCGLHPRPASVQPVRIAAGAFGPRVPCRPLYLSPNHAVFAEGVLIPIGALVNHGTVRSVDMARVVYFHVETATHDVVLAEGLPVETFLDTADGAFDEGVVAYGRCRAPCPDVAALWESAACAPLQVVGPAVDRVRAALADRDVAPRAAA